MTTASRLAHRLLSTLVVAVALFCGVSAHAQFQVALDLGRKTYVSAEPITATVTVTNRSGADVVLGGPSGRKWLTFTLRDSSDRALSPLDLESEDPIILKAGATTRKKMRILDTHAVEETGNYAATASVYHPASGQYYISNRTHFTVTDLRPFGQPMMFGVPEGYPEAGRVRRYVLMINRELDSSTMYFRLEDDATNSKLMTYPLGPITLAREPLVTMDRLNQLHVLFMTNRDNYTYAVLQPDGKPKSIRIIKDVKESHPQLFLTSTNDVVLKGGEIQDPNAPKEVPKGRSISERPPGL